LKILALVEPPSRVPRNQSGGISTPRRLHRNTERGGQIDWAPLPIHDTGQVVPLRHKLPIGIELLNPVKRVVLDHRRN
jgi:hypothetical protein